MSNKIVPKIIHTIAPASELKWHSVWKKCYDSWFKHFDSREFKFVMWDDDKSLENFIKKNYPEYLSFFKNIPVKVMKIDIARMLILHKHGGIYHDMDVFCYKNFYNFLKLKNSKLYVVEGSGDINHKNNKSIEPLSNCLIASVPKNDFFIKCIQLSSSLFNHLEKFVGIFSIEDDPDPQTLYLTGPILLSNTMGLIEKNFKFRELNNNFFQTKYFNKKEVCILQRKLFNPHILLYDESFYTKHFGSSVWLNVNEDMRNYDEALTKHIKNLTLDKFDFYKNYV